MKKSLLALSLAFLLPACFSGDEEDTLTDFDETQLTLGQVRLQRFASCRQFADTWRTRLRASRAIEGAPIPLVAEDSGAVTDDSGGPEFSAPHGETNVQVAGVDELDRAKADGDFIYRVEAYRDRLQVLRRLPVTQAGIVQEISLTPEEDGTYRQARGLMVTGEEVVVLANAGHRVPSPYPPPEPLPGASLATGVVAEPGRPYDGSLEISENRVVIQRFRRASGGTLTLREEVEVDGSLVSARLIGSRLHLVTQTELPYSWNPEILPDEEVVSQVLPALHRQTAEENLANCGDIWFEPISKDPVRDIPPLDSLLCVVSANLQSDLLETSNECVAGHYASIIYASTENLFVAGGGWQGHTPIHQFSLASHERDTQYAGTALMRGQLLNQFSLDEHEGHLRVAATRYDFDSSDFNWRAATSNQLAIFKLGGGDPELVGGITDIAVTERIYAVRFMGEKGFMVTFKKVDPLFALDLRDPRNPVIRGELKIPGYSSYLHSMQEGYLLAIGKDAEAAQESDDFAWYQGMAMSIFDVRDLENPRLLHKIGIGSRGTESEALQDHKAFRYEPESGLVVFPLVLYEGGEGQSHRGTYTFSGFQMYRASLEDGFRLMGSSPFSGGDGYSYRYDASGRSFHREGVLSLIGGGELVLRATSSPDEDLQRITL